LEQLEKTKGRISEAVVDPNQWPEVMQAICSAIGTEGAVLLQSDIRTSDVPKTPSLSELFRDYFENNFHLDDIRAIRGVPLLLSGRPVIRDQDIFRYENEMARNHMYAALGRHGFRWWSAVGFRSGSAHWALSLQRTIKQGLFEEEETKLLASLSNSLTEAATLSRAVGRRTLLGSLNALNMIDEAALSLTKDGAVVDINENATRLFDDEFCVRNRRLYVRDSGAARALEACLSEMNSTGELRLRPKNRTGNVIVARRRVKRPLLITVLPVDGAARTPFLDARFIVTLRDLQIPKQPTIALVAETFGLTPAEAKVATMVATGASPEEIADELKVSRETVRKQIKTVFGKTQTRRQSELAVLISRMRW
jgi:DNA-binding CsgD family transcriptional regulator